MSKYWFTTRHIKPKPSIIRLEHIWQHTLRYGRHAIATWTVTNLNPSMVASHNYLHEGQLDHIQVAIEAARNQVVRVIDLPTDSPKANSRKAKAQ